MNDQIEQSVTDELRLAAYSTTMAGLSAWGNLFTEAADTIDTLRAQLAEAQREAVSLARSLFKRHYAQEPHYASGKIEWEPFNEPASVISQIDNMVAGVCAQLAEARRDAEVSKQINRACMELPDDFRIAIELERDSGCVYLLQEDEDNGFDDPCDGIARSISAAIDAAKGADNGAR